MKVFEFIFNPKLKDDLDFESFSFEPANIYEKRVGNLYVIGFLKNLLPKNANLLKNLTKEIKENYYRFTAKGPENALKESLKKANQFLEEVAKTGDVSWLGNLDFAILSIKDFLFNFTKVGQIKIVLLRGKKIIDVDKKLNLEEIEPYPLKIFTNVVSGKLAENDLIVVSTKEIFDYLEEEKIFSQIVEIFPPDGKKINEIFKKRQEEIKNLSGILFLIFLSKEKTTSEKKFFFSEPKEKFSLSKLFPFLKSLKKRKDKKKNLTLFPNVEFYQPKFFLSAIKKIFNKNLILFFLLIFLLIFSSFFSRKEKENNIKEIQFKIKEIKEGISRAEMLTNLENQGLPVSEKPEKLWLQCWQKISEIPENDFLNKETKEEIFILKEKIFKNLAEINKLISLPSPKIFFEFQNKEFSPEKIVFNGENFFLFDSKNKNIFQINLKGEKKIIETEKPFSASTLIKEGSLFFSPPDHFLIIGNDGRISYFFLPDFKLYSEIFSGYESFLYFLEKDKGEIVKYKIFEWQKPVFWLDEKEEKIKNAKSMTVDGFIWILKEDNSLSRYFKGKKEEVLNVDVFPPPQNFSKILTFPNIPYLYLLEPPKKRILIINKKGKIVRQFQSEKFDNLLDFVVSLDGKKIYILNGMTIYEVDFSF